MSENNLKEYEDILKIVTKHSNTWWQWIAFILFLIISITGVITGCKCYWTNKIGICIANNPIDSKVGLGETEVETEITQEISGSKLDLSLKGKSNSNIRSDCFWLVIFFTLIILLMLLFYFISYSAKEKRLLQWILDIKELNIKK